MYWENIIQNVHTSHAMCRDVLNTYTFHMMLGIPLNFGRRPGVTEIVGKQTNEFWKTFILQINTLEIYSQT